MIGQYKLFLWVNSNRDTGIKPRLPLNANTGSLLRHHQLCTFPYPIVIALAFLSLITHPRSSSQFCIGPPLSHNTSTFFFTVLYWSAHPRSLSLLVHLSLTPHPRSSSQFCIGLSQFFCIGPPLSHPTSTFFFTVLYWSASLSPHIHVLLHSSVLVHLSLTPHPRSSSQFCIGPPLSHPTSTFFFTVLYWSASLSPHIHVLHSSVLVHLSLTTHPRSSSQFCVGPPLSHPTSTFFFTVLYWSASLSPHIHVLLHSSVLVRLSLTSLSQFCVGPHIHVLLHSSVLVHLSLTTHPRSSSQFCVGPPLSHHTSTFFFTVLYWSTSLSPHPRSSSQFCVGPPLSHHTSTFFFTVLYWSASLSPHIHVLLHSSVLVRLSLTHIHVLLHSSVLVRLSLTPHPRSSSQFCIGPPLSHPTSTFFFTVLYWSASLSPHIHVLLHSSVLVRLSLTTHPRSSSQFCIGPPLSHHTSTFFFTVLYWSASLSPHIHVLLHSSVLVRLSLTPHPRSSSQFCIGPPLSHHTSTFFFTVLYWSASLSPHIHVLLHSSVLVRLSLTPHPRSSSQFCIGPPLSHHTSTFFFTVLYWSASLSPHIHVLLHSSVLVRLSLTTHPRSSSQFCIGPPLSHTHIHVLPPLSHSSSVLVRLSLITHPRSSSQFCIGPPLSHTHPRSSSQFCIGPPLSHNTSPFFFTVLCWSASLSQHIPVLLHSSVLVRLSLTTHPRSSSQFCIGPPLSHPTSTFFFTVLYWSASLSHIHDTSTTHPRLLHSSVLVRLSLTTHPRSSSQFCIGPPLSHNTSPFFFTVLYWSASLSQHIHVLLHSSVLVRLSLTTHPRSSQFCIGPPLSHNTSPFFFTVLYWSASLSPHIHVLLHSSVLVRLSLTTHPRSSQFCIGPPLSHNTSTFFFTVLYWSASLSQHIHVLLHSSVLVRLSLTTHPLPDHSHPFPSNL